MAGLTCQPRLFSDNESKSAAGKNPAAGSLGCAVVKEVLAFSTAPLTSLESPGQEYWDISEAALVKGADEIGLHDYSDIIGIPRIRHLNFCSTRQRSLALELDRYRLTRPYSGAFLGWARERGREHFRSRRLSRSLSTAACGSR